jgi:hypothetical protein
MAVSPSNLQPATAAGVPAPPAPNTDPPPGTTVLQGQPDGSIVVSPLPLSFGGDDAGQINAACLQLQGQGADTNSGQNPGGVVVLGYGFFNCLSGIVVPATVSMRGQGNGSRIMVNFTGGIGVYHHRTNGYGGQFGNPAQQGCGYLRDFVIDGTGTGPGSVLLDVGDGIGIDVTNVECVNADSTAAFTANVAGQLTLPAGVSLPVGLPVIMQGASLPNGAIAGYVYYVATSIGNVVTLVNCPKGTAVTFGGSGSGTLLCSIGLHVTDYVFWSEKSFKYNVLVQNNAINVVLDTYSPGMVPGDVSLEYNRIEINMFCNAGQQGVAVSAGANLGGVRLHIYGNMSSLPVGLTQATAGVAMLTFSGQDYSGQNQSRMYSGELHTKVEGNPGNGQGNAVYPYAVFCASGIEYVRTSFGFLTHSLANSVLNGGEFSVAGMALTDTGLTQAFPSNFVSGGVNPPGTQTGQPTVPPSGKNFINYGMAMTVYVTAGVGGCTITKNGASVTFAAGITMPFTMNAGEEFSPAYTNAPTWVWVPAAQMQN